MGPSIARRIHDVPDADAVGMPVLLPAMDTIFYDRFAAEATPSFRRIPGLWMWRFTVALHLRIYYDRRFILEDFMVDIARILAPNSDELLRRALQVSDPFSYKFRTDNVKKVIREANASDELKEALIAHLDLEVFQGREYCGVAHVAIEVAEFTKVTNDMGIISISGDLRNLDKLPFALIGGKPVN
jgi:hypothetical protein